MLCALLTETAVYSERALKFENCAFTGNKASIHGGGLYFYSFS